MSNASSAPTLQLSLVISGARKFLKTVRGARLTACVLSIASLGIQSAHAAPFAYVANYLDGTVSVIDVATGSPVTASPILVGTAPLDIVMNPAGTFVYVSNFGSDTVSVINTSNNTAQATQIAVGVQPQYMKVSPDGKTLYVVNLGGAVSVVDTATATETTKIQVGNYPVGAALTPDGSTLYVSESSVGKVAVINTSTNAVTNTINVGNNPLAVTMSPNGKQAFVANYYDDTVSVIDTSTNAVTKTIKVDAGPHDIAFNPAGTFAYVTNYLGGVVDVIDTTSYAIPSVIPVGTAATTSTGPLGISIDSKGMFAYVSNSVEDTISVIDLSVNVTVPGAINTGGTPTYSVLSSYAGLTSVNLDQHGLTGTWYESAVSGQGFVLEVYPDINGAGNGIMAGGWFTYDVTAAGGQRWYSLQGNVSSSNPVATLNIGTAVGGNFAAGPIVGATNVGQAILQFSDCTHGVLTYTFNDGSNRSGQIPLQRLTANTTCGIGGDNNVAPGGYLLSGNWYDPATSGQGFSFDINPAQSLLSASWYTYAPTGQQIGSAASQRWYSIQTGLFTDGNKSISGAPIYAVTGGIFHDPTTVTATPVGTANIQFIGCSSATLAYSFTAGDNQGLSGSINLQRIGPTPANCR